MFQANAFKLKNRSQKYGINRPQPRNGHKYNKYKVSQYDDGNIY